MSHVSAHEDEPSQPYSDERHDDGFLVVGLGASAGGIAALKAFFTHVPRESGAAYVVILHLSPDYDSKLSEVLQTATALPVAQVRTPVPIKPDHVYVVSPSMGLAMAGARIVPSAVTRPEERRSPVDVFFRTLADSYGPNAVSVVLSGTGSNGSSGLKRVKERGGLAIAQDPDEAEHRDMPHNAIATGLVDYVAPVAQIPGQILAYRHRLRRTVREIPQVTRAETQADAFREVLTVLRARTGHDFSNYKPATILRRIQRRMSVAGVSTLSEYVTLLQEQREEPRALMTELLISVTNFFRDADAYAVLEHKIVPRLFHGKQDADEVRAWVAGCATGEEAYSVAMLLTEYAAARAIPPPIQVFATDLDERAIAIAREGFYTDAEVADVPEERLHRFFHRDAGGYRIRRELREMVLFAHHNVIKDPPFSHLDLLTCRNLLIYLNRSIQEQLLETFHFALRPGGFLFLGTSESPADVSDLFTSVDKSAHIYESRGVASRRLFRSREVVPAAAIRLERRAPVGPGPERMLPVDLHQRLLEQYAPPSLLVTEEYALVHVSEHAGQYLQVGVGEPSRDLLKLVHPDLLLDLRTALYHAARERTNVSVHGVRLPSRSPAGAVAIHVRPVLREGDPARGFFLIIFEPEELPPVSADTVRMTSPVAGAERDLEQELSRVKGQLGTTIEQYESQVEEAKASNEELQAANEELRSSAEELETSKEELQSVNEELATVNQELKIKIEELRVTGNDFQNFINATSVPAIFLDRGLRVKFATTSAHDIFHVRPSDVGRPLADITSKITYDGVLHDAAEVLQRLHTVEREVRTRERGSYLMRILPYRTIDDRIEGVVLTFLDITTLRQAEADVLAGEERQHLLIDSAVDYAIFTMTSQGRIDSWNPGAERMFGYTAVEIIGRSFSALFSEEEQAAGAPDAELARAAHEGRALDERYHRRKDGTLFYASGVTTRLGQQEPFGFAKISRDLTRQREAEEALTRARAELETRVAQRTAELQEEREQSRALLTRLVTAQEEQRARIARDLHDQLGQHLTALRIALERGQQQRASSAGADDELERALSLTTTINKELDFLASELRPALLDDLGLAAALPRFLKDWSKQYGIHSECRVSGFNASHLTKEQEVTYYRIAQEALTNVVRHAHASRVDVVLETRDGTVILVVADDGVGFDAADRALVSEKLGLLGMKERAAIAGAALEIESSPGHGTTIYLRSTDAGSRREAT